MLLYTEDPKIPLVISIYSELLEVKSSEGLKLISLVNKSGPFAGTVTLNPLPDWSAQDETGVVPVIPASALSHSLILLSTFAGPLNEAPVIATVK